MSPACRHCHHRLRVCWCGIGSSDEGHWVTAIGTPLPDAPMCGPYPDGERWRRHEPEGGASEG